VPAVVARVEKGLHARAYLPREVFFFGFGFPGAPLPAARCALLLLFRRH
jgi:hypothetical protein